MTALDQRTAETKNRPAATIDWRRIGLILAVASALQVIAKMFVGVLRPGDAGIDFAVFVAGGSLARQGDWETLYDGERFTDHLREEVFPQLSDEALNTFISTPPFAQASQPLASLPLSVALTIWTIAGVLAVVVVVRTLRLSPKWALGLLLSPALVVNAAIGQSGILFLTMITSLHCLLIGDRRFGAGVMLGILFVLKPPLAVGYGLWWLVTTRRSLVSILGAIVGTVLAAMPSVISGTDPWVLFTETMRSRIAIESSWQLNGVSLPEAMKLLSPVSPTWFTLVAWAVSIVLGGVCMYFAARRWSNDVAACSAAAVAVTVLVSPHLAVYDTALLIVPMAVLVQRGIRRDRLLALIVIHMTTLAFGSALYDAQYSLFGRGISIEFVGYATSLILAWRWLDQQPQPEILVPVLTDA
jgi:hypothetical protein